MFLETNAMHVITRAAYSTYPACSGSTTECWTLCRTFVNITYQVVHSHIKDSNSINTVLVKYDCRDCRGVCTRT